MPARAKSSPVTRVPAERTQFRFLIAANPNYFGTLPLSPLPIVKALNRQTTYEELLCVGLQPETSQLEAVVRVKQSSGYSGGLCSGGSHEYVRFYLSYDGGATWQDEGATQIAVYDVPGPKPLDFGVSRPVRPQTRSCLTENLIRVRAILSWNVPPTPNDPSFSPVWGNVLEAVVQVAPRRRLPLSDLVADAKIKLPANVLALVEGAPDLELNQPAELAISDLHALYAKTNVPAHRYLFKALDTEMTSASSGLLAQPVEAMSILADLKIDSSKLINAVQKTDGDTRYEELTCVGFDPNNDALTAVVNLKLSSGYSGGLCTAGSREYVAFWIDWNDGAGWGYAGTASFAAHDLSGIPPEGLKYAVFEVVNVAGRRRACQAGPVLARVRAILSWQTMPPAGNPDWIPTWGNREEREFLVPPAGAEDYRPILESVSYVPVCNIDQVTGRTKGSYDQPFGGLVRITGFIPTAPDVSTPVPSLLRYRVSVRKHPAGAWETLTNSFSVSVIERIGAGLPAQYPILQEIGLDNYYVYREDMNSSGAGWRLVQNRVLADWITADPMTGRYDIRVEAKDPTTNIVYAGQAIACPDGSTRSIVTIELDEIAPTCDVAITGYRRGGGPLQPAMDCDTFRVRDVISGTYAVADAHFGGLTLTVEPVAPAHGAAPSPGSRAYPVVATSGETGTWSLDTAGMDPCGYIVRLWSWDRTIVSLDGSGRKCSDSVGFCLNR